MRNIHLQAAALAVAATSLVTAQTFTTCDPTKKKCDNVPGLAQSSYSVDLTDGIPKDWGMTFGEMKTSSKGGLFQINSLTDGPTIASDFSIFFGSVEITLQAAPGAGIVSTFVMESIDLDEIDLEIIGSETGRVQSNYFGKGNTTTYDRGRYHPVKSPQTSFHTYKVDWKPDFTKWYIDGQLVRTLAFADAVDGKNYPQTPINVRIGNWVAGRPGNQQGTISWAGGLADMSKAPFNMYVTKVNIQNDNPCAEYEYTDRTGDWQSIKCASGAPAGSSPPKSSSSPDKTSDAPVPSSKTHESSTVAISSTQTVASSSAPADVSPPASSPATTAAGKPPHVSGGAAGASSPASDMSEPCEESSLTPVTKTPTPTPPIGTGLVSTPVSPIVPTSVPQTQVTVIVTKSLTTCPIGHTVTSGSVTTTLSTPSVSTIYLTTTSTICTRCTEMKTIPQYPLPTYTNGSLPSPPPPASPPVVPVPSQPAPSAPAPAAPTPAESPVSTPVSPIDTATSTPDTLTFSAPQDTASTISATSTVTLTSAIVQTATLPAYGQGNSTTAAPTGSVAVSSIAVSPITSAPTSVYTGAASRNSLFDAAGLLGVFVFYMAL